MRPANKKTKSVKRAIRRLLSNEGIEMVSAVISAVISAVLAPFLAPFLISFITTCVPMLFSSFTELLLTSFEVEGTLSELLFNVPGLIFTL